MPNFFQALGAPEAQRAINQFQTDLEERPRREELFQRQKALDLQTIEMGRIKLEEAKKQEEFLNKKVNFAQMLTEKGELHPNTIKRWEDGFKNIGAIDQTGMITHRDLAKAIVQMEQQEKIMKNIFTYDIEQRGVEVAKAWKKVENARKSGATQQELMDAEKAYDDAKSSQSIAAERLGQVDKHYKDKREVHDILRSWEGDPKIKAFLDANPQYYAQIKMAPNPETLKAIQVKAAEASFKPEKTPTTHPPVEKPINVGGKKYIQKFAFNTETNAWDIPFGDKVPAKEEKEGAGEEKSVDYQRRYARGKDLIDKSFMKFDTLGNVIANISGEDVTQYSKAISKYKELIDKGVDEIKAADQAVKEVKPPKIPTENLPYSGNEPKGKKVGYYQWKGKTYHWSKEEGWRLQSK